MQGKQRCNNKKLNTTAEVFATDWRTCAPQVLHSAQCSQLQPGCQNACTCHNFTLAVTITRKLQLMQRKQHSMSIFQPEQECAYAKRFKGAEPNQ
jgi:hypothetical protein